MSPQTVQKSARIEKGGFLRLTYSRTQYRIGYPRFTIAS